jgi:hypothetical protein
MFWKSCDDKGLPLTNVTLTVGSRVALRCDREFTLAL